MILDFVRHENRAIIPEICLDEDKKRLAFQNTKYKM